MLEAGERDRRKRMRAMQAASLPCAVAVTAPRGLLRQVQAFGGNQAVLRLLHSGSQVQRCGRAGCPCTAQSSEEEKPSFDSAAPAVTGASPVAHEGGRLSGQGVAGVEEEEFPPAEQRLIRRQAVVPPAGAAPARLQRVATWSPGAVHQVNNLASAILNGTPVGVTWPMLNGSTFWSAAAARSALAKPTLAFASSSGGGVEASVAMVPQNTGSFDETVLAAGPWSLVALKAAVGARFSSLAACTGAGNSTFSARGKPTDAAMFAANRRHEDKHAADHKVAFTGSVDAWDKKLTAAKDAGKTFNGPTEAAAEAALYAAMGGTPDQIADKLMNDAQAAVVAYHATPGGGGVSAENPTANADCSTSSIESTNPS